MRLRVLVTLAALLAPAAAQAVSDTYDWHEGADGFNEVFEIAAKGNRPVFLLFSVEWCGYCRKLKKDYLGRSPVDDFIGDYLRVDVNPEKGSDERAIADRYGVRGYPTFLVLFPGQEKPYHISPLHNPKDATPEEFVEEMKKALAWSYCKRGTLFWDQKDYRASQPFFEAALALLPEDSWAHYCLGVACARVGEAEKDPALLRRGEASFAKAVEIKPDYQAAKSELEKVRRALGANSTQ